MRPVKWCGKKRKRDQKFIERKQISTKPAVEEIESNGDRKTLEVEDLTITIQGATSDDEENISKRKKKKVDRREVQKEFFIPYQPSDFNRERGLEVNSFEQQTNDAMMDLTNDEGSKIRGPTVQKTKWDRKKKKFVTIGQNDGKMKKIKTESGQWINASYKTNAYKKWLNKSGGVEKNPFENRRNNAGKDENENSTVRAKPRKFDEKVKHLMNRQKSKLKEKGQKMPSHSELKKPEQIMKKRTENRQRNSLQRARQSRKAGRTNYKNKRKSSKTKFSKRSSKKT